MHKLTDYEPPMMEELAFTEELSLLQGSIDPIEEENFGW